MPATGAQLVSRLFAFPIPECIIESHTSVAVARNPEKLHNMLTQRGVEDAKVRQEVTIIEGSIMDTETVAKTLKGSEIIIFSVGMCVSAKALMPLGPNRLSLYPSLFGN